MPKLPTIKPREIIQILKKNGFIVDHITGSHYILFNSITKKRVTVPFHNKDLPKGTTYSIIKYSGIGIKEFI